MGPLAYDQIAIAEPIAAASSATMIITTSCLLRCLGARGIEAWGCICDAYGPDPGPGVV